MISFTERYEKAQKGAESLRSACSEARRRVSIVDECLSPEIRHAISLPSTPIRTKKMTPRRLTPMLTPSTPTRSLTPISSIKATPIFDTPASLAATPNRHLSLLKKPKTPATPKSLKRVHFRDECNLFPTCASDDLNEAFFDLKRPCIRTDFPTLKESAQMLDLKSQLTANYREAAALKEKLQTFTKTPTRKNVLPSKKKAFEGKLKAASPDDITKLMKKEIDRQILEIALLKVELGEQKRKFAFMLPLMRKK